MNNYEKVKTAWVDRGVAANHPTKHAGPQPQREGLLAMVPHLRVGQAPVFNARVDVERVPVCPDGLLRLVVVVEMGGGAHGSLAVRTGRWRRAPPGKSDARNLTMYVPGGRGPLPLAVPSRVPQNDIRLPWTRHTSRLPAQIQNVIAGFACRTAGFTCRTAGFAAVPPGLLAVPPALSASYLYGHPSAWWGRPTSGTGPTFQLSSKHRQSSSDGRE